MPLQKIIAISVIVAAVAATAQATAPSATVQARMKMIVEPASNTLFGVGGEVDPANGPDAAKVPAARWSEAADAAAKLQAEARALEQEDLARDQGDWIGFARQMGAAAERAAKAATAHDGAALSQAANDLSDVCSGCHAKYKTQS